MTKSLDFFIDTHAIVSNKSLNCGVVGKALGIQIGYLKTNYIVQIISKRPRGHTTGFMAFPKETRVMRGKGNVPRKLGYQRVVYMNVALEGG